MKVINDRRLYWLIAVFMLAALLGCTEERGTESSLDNVEEDVPEPFTLKFLNAVGTDEDAINNMIIQPAKEEFPHIKIEVIPPGTPLPELIANDELPDIIFSNANQFRNLVINNELAYDLSAFIDKHNVDLSRYNETVMDSIRGYADNALYAFPLTANREFLYYNKDLFDQFGVPYLEDGVTWEEIYRVAQQLTQEHDGVLYRGIDLDWSKLISWNQLSLPLLDAETDKAIVNTDEWRMWFDTMRLLYDIPGTYFGEEQPDRLESFLAGELAMTNGQTVAPFTSTEAEDTFQLGIVTLPTFTEAPELTIQAYYTQYSIASTSEYKEEAFQVLSYVLTDDVLTDFVKTGRQVAVESINMEQYYAMDYPSITENVSLSSIFKHDFAPSPPGQSEYEVAVRPIMHDAFRAVINDEKDISTALREAEDLINQEVEELKKKN